MSRKFLLLVLIALCSLKLVAQQQQVDTSVKEIILVFKTHFDIGYTDFAEAVVQKYSSTMMENALAIVEKNKNLPSEKQFVWTVSGWPMEQMVQHSDPALKPKIEQALKNGRFAVHALPFSMETESADPESLVRGMNISSSVSRKEGLPLPRDAKMSDVPSHSWILPTLLTNAGVNFLHIGCNPASQSPQVPVLFWWQGPDGSKLMTMYSEKYYGTSLLPPSDWPYKTWLALMQTNDNDGPPTPETVDKYLADIHKYAPNAKVRIGRLSDFYNAIIKESPQLPTVKGDMPDTWIHGFMSMPREVKDSRRVNSDLLALESANKLYNLWTNKGYDISKTLYEAYENNLLFNEHTFGMAMSHLENGTWSYGDEFKQQRAAGVYDAIEKSWKEKSDRVFAADKVVTSSLERQLKELAAEVKWKGSRIFVYNALPWQRDGLVTLHAGSESNPGNAVKDIETGEVMPISNEKNVIQFVAKNIPASGYRNYVLVNDSSLSSNEIKVDEQANIIENKFYKIQLDPAKGAITSVIEKTTGRELVNQKSEYGFGQYLYERFSKKDAENYTDSYVKAMGKEWANAELGRPNLTEGPHVTEKGSSAKIMFTRSAVGASATMLFAPNQSIPHDYSITISLVAKQPYIELVWNINAKPAEPWPEAGWISLPFNVDNPSFKLGRLGGIVDPATDFVKGSNVDYGFLNTGMAVIGKNGNGVGLSSPYAPGVSLDRPGLWKYSIDFVPQRPNVFVNLYNNLWSTNFTEWIEGSWSTKIYLWSVDQFSNESSIITPSEEFRSPLKTVMAYNDGGSLPVAASGVQLSMKGVVVTAFGNNPDGKGTILRLWEQAGNSGHCIVTLPANHPYKTARFCNLRGEPLSEGFKIKNTIDVNIKAYEPISIQLQ
ncbi:MAG TPA: glycosyl hydrolase-related protein [Parafilimonas sp.]|nr:glycosyl hydrolase-related protein [Parafilimonas sp.]